MKTLAATCAFCFLSMGLANASGTSEVEATISKWVDDFNKGDLKSLLAACAPNAVVIDGFSPFVWPTCIDWMNDYQANSAAQGMTDARLWIGRRSHLEVIADRGYAVYPAKFSFVLNGSNIACSGTWTLTLQRTSDHWVFTGLASSWAQTSVMLRHAP